MTRFSYRAQPITSFYAKEEEPKQEEAPNEEEPTTAPVTDPPTASLVTEVPIPIAVYPPTALRTAAPVTEPPTDPTSGQQTYDPLSTDITPCDAAMIKWTKRCKVRLC